MYLDREKEQLTVLSGDGILVNVVGHFNEWVTSLDDIAMRRRRKVVYRNVAREPFKKLKKQFSKIWIW